MQSKRMLKMGKISAISVQSIAGTLLKCNKSAEIFPNFGMRLHHVLKFFLVENT